MKLRCLILATLCIAASSKGTAAQTPPHIPLQPTHISLEELTELYLKKVGLSDKVRIVGVSKKRDEVYAVPTKGSDILVILKSNRKWGDAFAAFLGLGHRNAIRSWRYGHSPSLQVTQVRVDKELNKDEEEPSQSWAEFLRKLFEPVNQAQLGWRFEMDVDLSCPKKSRPWSMGRHIWENILHFVERKILRQEGITNPDAMYRRLKHWLLTESRP